jgi:hypothetical protein
MVGHSHMVAAAWGAHVARNPLTTVDYLNGLVADTNIDLLLDQREGHRIPRTVDFDMVVGCHAGALPSGEGIGFRRQWLKVRAGI